MSAATVLKFIDKKFSNKKELKKITVNKIEAPTMSGEDIDKIIEFLQDKLGIKYSEKKGKKKSIEESQEIMQEIKDVKAEKLADEIEKDLSGLKNEITVLKQKFDA